MPIKTAKFPTHPGSRPTTNAEAVRQHPLARGRQTVKQRACAELLSDAGREPMRVTLGWPPSSNHLFATVQGRRVLSAEGKQYKANVRAKLFAENWKPFTGPVVLELNVYRPRKRADLDNRIKLIQDSLSGFAYLDDEQVVKIVAERFESPDNPRVEVTITAARKP